MPLLWLSLAFLSGLVLAHTVLLPLPVWGAFTCLALLGLLLRRLAGRLRFLVGFPGSLVLPLPKTLLILAILAGAFRLELERPRLEAGHIGVYAAVPGQASETYEVEGWLVEPPEQGQGYTALRLRVEKLRPYGSMLFQPAQGDLVAWTDASGPFEYGQRLRLAGFLEQPAEREGFSYREYLARQGVFASMPSASVLVMGHDRGNPLRAGLYRLRQNGSRVIARLYPEPEASLLAGIVLGDESGIPPDLESAFETTGLTHIIAISGFNMALIAGLFSSGFGRWLGPRRGALAAMLAIGFYTLLVGAQASVVRAAIMAGLSLLGSQLGRRQYGLNSLAFVAALMAVFEPFVLWDVGFQLSFMATLGLVLYAGPMDKAFRSLAGRWLSGPALNRVAGPVGEYFLFTLAAQITTLPVTVYHFQRLSLISLAANPVALPVQPAVMIAGGLSVALGLVWLPLGRLVSWAALPFLSYTIRVVELFAGVPGGSLALGDVALPLVLLFYAVLFGLTFARQYPRLNRLPRPAMTFMALVALTALVWRSALSLPDGNLHLTILDVGAGEAVLIQSPEGRYVLVNGGSSALRLSDAVGRRLPPGMHLDWLVVGATGDEQLGALPDTLERWQPENVLWAGPPAGSRSARRLQRQLAGLGIPTHTAQSGEVLDLGQGASLQVLTASGRGAAFLIMYGSFRAILPVGPNFDDLAALQADPSLRGVDVLLLSDSGYAPANPPELLDALQPQLVLLSVDPGDRRGLPPPETLAALQGRSLLRTDRNGWINISTDGQQMWVEVERGPVFR